MIRIPKFKTGKTPYSSKVYNHIAKWEASDFKEQNAKMGGNAVLAKRKELEGIVPYLSSLEQDVLDTLLSTYYNISPDSFRSWFMNELNAYYSNPSQYTFNILRNKLLNRHTYMSKDKQKQYGRGIKRRAVGDVNLMNNTYNKYNTTGILKDKSDFVNIPTVRLIVEQSPARQYGSNQSVLKIINAEPYDFLNSIDIPYETPAPVHMSRNIFPSIRLLLEQQIFQPILK